VPRFLAIDWDQNQLHVVSGSAGGGKVKFQRALVWNEEKSPNPADAEELGRLLRERLKSAGVAPAPVLACLGRDRVILKDLRFPAVPAAEEAGVVRFQAVKELSDSPDDVVIDYVGVAPPGASEQQVLALIVRKELVGAYQKMCQTAGLKLAALTPRPFGVAASVWKATAGAASPEEADGAAAVVVVGERWAEFCVLRGETPLLSRSLIVGSGLAGEVRRNLTVYAGTAGRPPVRVVHVAGAAPELLERLGEMLDVPIREFDPLAGAVGLDVTAGARGSFAGAAGLLFARAESRGLPINFVQPRQPRPQRDPKNRRIALVGAALAVAIAVVVVCCWVIYASAVRRLAGIQTVQQNLDAALQAKRKDGKLIAALDNWDNADVLDEIYDLTDRIPDVNALRITHFSIEPTTRTSKAKYTARITLRGNCAGDQGRKALDALIDGFKKDGYYSPDGSPRMVGNQFTLTVNVERRPPGDYTRALKSAPSKGDKNAMPDDLGDVLP
jgi:hypothetical protein